MKKFGYFRDELFLAAMLLYVVNRVVVKPHFPHGFFAWWFSDSLLIPCALPVLLWMERRVGLRKTDDYPNWFEIIFALVVWSVLFEVIAPRFYARATGDWRDIISYVIGGIIAGIWWQWRRKG